MENNNQKAYNRAGEIMASDGCTFEVALERVALKEPWLFDDQDMAFKYGDPEYKKRDGEEFE